MRGMRSSYPHGPYQVRGWGPPPAPDPTSQLLGSLGDSLAEGIENLLSLVEQSTSLMRPMSMPMTMPMAPAGPWGRGRSRGRHGWEHTVGERDGHHRPDCGCEHHGEKWRDHGQPDCGCGDHHEGLRHHKHKHHGHDREHGCGCEGRREPGCGCRDGRERDCGCGRCGDDCHCVCCVAGADLVVETRLGERRVVTLEVVNERRRERDITLELGAFTTRGGSPAPVAGAVDGATTFKLAPCSEHLVPIVIEVGIEREGLPDVDDCLVAWSDLKVEGCDIRPVRIAVAILPRDCGAYRVRCACGCCC
jgi:hypothetical protein